MPIPLEKQKQVRKYLQRLVDNKYTELESSIQTKEEAYEASGFEKKRKVLEKTFLSSIKKYNKALEDLQSLAEKHDYYPCADSSEKYYRHSIKEYRVMDEEICENDVRELVKKEYRKSIQDQIEKRKENLSKKEIEITEKILFAEDEEIYKMVQNLKDINMDI